MEEKTVTTDIPLPHRPKAPAPAALAGQDHAAAAAAAAGARPAPPLPPAPTVGTFFAEGRALVDGRRMHLGRVGMLPEHVAALAMPDLAEKPLALPLRTEDLPQEATFDKFEPKKMPKADGVLEA